MRTLNQCLTDYGKTRRNPGNRKTHFACMPAIVLGMLAVLAGACSAATAAEGPALRDVVVVG
ncbi:MAG: hypothetical protein ACRESV_08840, partial [Nevskiales bacterium]